MQIRLPCFGLGRRVTAWGRACNRHHAGFILLTKRFSSPKGKKRFSQSLKKQRPSRMKAMRMSTNCGRQHAGLLC